MTKVKERTMHIVFLVAACMSILAGIFSRAHTGSRHDMSVHVCQWRTSHPADWICEFYIW